MEAFKLLLHIAVLYLCTVTFVKGNTTYLGCHQVTASLTSHGAMTVSQCITACADSGFMYLTYNFDPTCYCSTKNDTSHERTECFECETGYNCGQFPGIYGLYLLNVTDTETTDSSTTLSTTPLGTTGSTTASTTTTVATTSTATTTNAASIPTTASTTASLQSTSTTESSAATVTSSSTKTTTPMTTESSTTTTTATSTSPSTESTNTASTGSSNSLALTSYTNTSKDTVLEECNADLLVDSTKESRNIILAATLPVAFVIVTSFIIVARHWYTRKKRGSATITDIDKCQEKSAPTKNSKTPVSSSNKNIGRNKPPVNHNRPFPRRQAWKRVD